MSSAEENKAILRRFFEAHAKGDLDTLRELLAPDFVDHRPLPGQEDPDRESYIQFVAERKAALSDIRFIVEDQAAEGDRVVSRLTIRFTHDQREIVGFAPTGKEYEVTVTIIDRIEGSKIVEEWTEGSDVEEMWKARRAGDTRARAHRAGATAGKAHPASLAPRCGAHPRGMTDRPLLPASQRGWGRLLRLPPPS